MAGCILRVEGKNLSIPPQLAGEGTRYGFVVDVTDKETFVAQVKEATTFLSLHKGVVSGIAKSAEVTAIQLDFGVWNLAPDTLAQSHSFPAALVALAGECGIALCVSIYVASVAP